ncbi:ATP-binding protein [Luteibacter sp. 329MFSha]|uniref:AAA family ATPase n=1 Tax=Luteibacter sp. 329MFSha TaxID=1798239 RepID=UPI0008D15CA6|nr:ATP-binding protein [Luteibacter sp. 329MFSha]SEV83548.1 Predicted ATPase [Luteibacter sp. 329MFSha]
MRTLEVKSFSCIDKALLELNDITVIIGPQASGKSVICKLFYFFNGIFSSLPLWVQESNTSEEIRDRCLDEFSAWFPPQAWGSKQFEVTYRNGPYELSIRRVKTRNGQPKAKLICSPDTERLFESAVAVHLKAAQKKRDPDFLYGSFSIVRRTIEGAMGRHMPDMQLYIPAGRSFFTSIGKLVTAFEERTLLDPVVHEFGRLVTNLRESSFYEREEPSPVLQRIEALIGGRVSQERGKQFLVTPDGRSIPFNALSSGQQELLPLLYALRFSLWRERGSLTFVEEPEAHLFPSAQTSLLEMFAEIVNRQPRRTGNKNVAGRTLVLTTHSPYVLAKMNTLIKAGQVARRLSVDGRKELDKLIPSGSWISPEKASAYAIHGRELVPILDEYGLIDAGYIDSVSEETGLEFDGLLDLEASL